MPPLEGPSAPCRGLRQPPCWSAWPVRSRDQQTTTDHLSENVSNDILGPVGRAEASRRRLQRRAMPTPTAATHSVLHSPWQQHGSASTSPAICPPAGRECSAAAAPLAPGIAPTTDDSEGSGTSSPASVTSSRCAPPGQLARSHAALEPPRRAPARRRDRASGGLVA